MPKIKSLNKAYEISGFVLGDTLEQYFDGVKIREYYGQVRTTGWLGQLAFERDVINMELKKKSSGETVYKQSFSIKDETNIVPKFYFDGQKIANSYSYPSPEGADYSVNFYLDNAGGPGLVDINIGVLEYYYDSSKQDPLVVVNTTSFPIAQNVKPGAWTPYFKIPIPMVMPQQSGTELYPIVVVRDAKTKEYYVNNLRDASMISMELPYDGVAQGKVQSMFLAKKIAYAKVYFLETFELTQLFPR
ncbi:MAG: hypothetical protein EOO88_51170 [Pedobacter sp.]|nr:MAG: hypothetical protein EOO88_51170 [Pedobacter sp.]